MIEVIIDSVRVSLMSQHRIVVLKDLHSDRYLPIWIGPFEAESITIELQETPPQRPLTHDLLNTVIHELGARVVHILINDLREDVYYARIVLEVSGDQIEIDARPSDAVNLAARAKSPIFVSEALMDRAAVHPDEDVEQEIARGALTTGDDVGEEKLSAFVDFVEGLDLDDLEDED